MSDIAIRVEGLSKRYRLGQQVGYNTLRETLLVAYHTPTRVLAGAVRRARGHGPHTPEPGTSDSTEHIWALKDISFEARRGEVVGIIGRNGAGKSTLLKILSRITTPTDGYAEIRGRVGSLLEVGTGFHPELTGRENIYLNGAIIGMSRSEIDRKFDEIVSFAEIERFLDTPVKRYSSGMYVRLAFAVAAHLDSEVLLVDEVLAVGDANFQNRCLGKMGDVAREGRTILFVSHNVGAVLTLCPRSLLLVDGRKYGDGTSDQVMAQYLQAQSQKGGEALWENPSAAPGNDRIRLHSVRIVSDGKATSDVDIGKDVDIEIEFWNFKPDALITTSIHLLGEGGVGVLASANMHSANLVRDEWFGKPHPGGRYRTICRLPGNFLNDGQYAINAIVLTGLVNTEVFAREVVSFTAHDTGSMRKDYAGRWLGVVRPKLAWQTEYLGPTDSEAGRLP